MQHIHPALRAGGSPVQLCKRHGKQAGGPAPSPKHVPGSTGGVATRRGQRERRRPRLQRAAALVLSSPSHPSATRPLSSASRPREAGLANFGSACSCSARLMPQTVLVLVGLPASGAMPRSQQCWCTARRRRSCRAAVTCSLGRPSRGSQASPRSRPSSRRAAGASSTRTGWAAARRARRPARRRWPEGAASSSTESTL